MGEKAHHSRGNRQPSCPPRPSPLLIPGHHAGFMLALGHLCSQHPSWAPKPLLGRASGLYWSNIEGHTNLGVRHSRFPRDSVQSQVGYESPPTLTPRPEMEKQSSAFMEEATGVRFSIPSLTGSNLAQTVVYGSFSSSLN